MFRRLFIFLAFIFGACLGTLCAEESSPQILLDPNLNDQQEILNMRKLDLRPGDILPRTDVMYYLGNSNYKWLGIFASSITTSNLYGLTSLSVSTLSCSSCTLSNVTVSTINIGAVVKAGTTAFSVLQIIQATTASNFSTASGSFQTTNLTASITPKSTSSKIFIFTSMTINQAGANRGAQLAIFRDTTNLCDASGCGQHYGSASSDIGQVSLIYLDSPNSTSAITYSVKGLSSDAVSSISFGNGRTQVMILVEVLQ